METEDTRNSSSINLRKLYTEQEVFSLLATFQNIKHLKDEDDDTSLFMIFEVTVSTVSLRLLLFGNLDSK